MKRNGPRYIAAVLVCTMLFSLLPAHAMAQQEGADTDTDTEVCVQDETDETENAEEDATPAGETIVADFADDIPDNDELFAGYVQQVFYPELATATYSDYAERYLGDEEYAIYKAVKAEIEKIAAGERASTVIDIPGINSIKPKSLQRIYYFLLYDCPYEMYWHNKALGCFSYPTDSGISLWFAVDEDYANADVVQPEVERAVAGDDWGEDEKAGLEAAKTYAYTVDTAQAQRAVKAKANADAIVAEYASLDDREKLTAYKDKICALNKYNYDAVTKSESDDTFYGDPWQMIYVFDGDDSTNVVCEGYSKAFQYLCDQSEFTGDVRCYTVSGTMSSTLGSGAHMWNIVTLEGENYLVDVTNSDENSVGQYGDLFLAEGSGSMWYGYRVYYRAWETGPRISYVLYEYDKETLQLYDRSVLTLAGSQSGMELDPNIELDRNNEEKQAADESAERAAKGTDAETLLLLGVGLVGVAVVVYYFYWRPVSLAGVAYGANGAALPYATVRLLRGERVLATTTADATGAYQITARGADTLEVRYTDPETGEEVVTRQPLENGLENGLENEPDNENALALWERESLRETA